MQKNIGFRTDEAEWRDLVELAGELQKVEGRNVTLGEVVRRCITKGKPLVRHETKGEVIPYAHKLTHFQQMTIVTERALRIGFQQLNQSAPDLAALPAQSL